MIPGSGRCPREGIGFPLQDPCASLVAQLVKNPSAHNVGTLGSIPGLGRSLGEGKDYSLHILAWRIPWGWKEWDGFGQLPLSLMISPTYSPSSSFSASNSSHLDRIYHLMSI